MSETPATDAEPGKPAAAEDAGPPSDALGTSAEPDISASERVAIASAADASAAASIGDQPGKDMLWGREGEFGHYREGNTINYGLMKTGTASVDEPLDASLERKANFLKSRRCGLRIGESKTNVSRRVKRESIFT